MTRRLPLVRAFAVSVIAMRAVTGCSSSGDAATPAVDAGTEPDAPLSPIERGGDLVVRHACGDCHTSKDPADGLLSGQTTPRLGTSAYAANITPDDETGIGLWTNDEVVAAIRHGIGKNEPLCSTMPRFNGLTIDDCYRIAEYLESIPPVHHVIPESTCKLKPRDGGPE